MEAIIAGVIVGGLFGFAILWPITNRINRRK